MGKHFYLCMILVLCLIMDASGQDQEILVGG
jgi:hypothetical protein